MRTNSKGIKFSNGLLFDCFEIKYAILGCLSFTAETDKLTEMLLHVLLCSFLMQRKMPEEKILNIIDNMVEIIGPDYADYKSYAPAKILNSFDVDTRMILFRYMNNSQSKIKDDRLRIAQCRLEEKLDFEYGNVRNNRFFEPGVYLSVINDYLTNRLNEISMRIAREIYQCRKS